MTPRSSISAGQALRQLSAAVDKPSAGAPPASGGAGSPARLGRLLARRGRPRAGLTTEPRSPMLERCLAPSRRSPSSPLRHPGRWRLGDRRQPGRCCSATRSTRRTASSLGCSAGEQIGERLDHVVDAIKVSVLHAFGADLLLPLHRRLQPAVARRSAAKAAGIDVLLRDDPDRPDQAGRTVDSQADTGPPT